MISRFNYTNRQPIPRSHIFLSLIEMPEGRFQIGGHVNLQLKEPLAPSAQIIVEAYKGSLVMRFDFGTVANQRPPENAFLDHFPRDLRPLFRIKVVEEGPQRKLLALAESFSPKTTGEIKAGRNSILPVEPADLGHLVWKLDFEGNAVRALQLNRNFHESRDITSLALDPDFIALVYPAVINQILQRLLLGPEHEIVEPDHEWLVFAHLLAGREAPDRNEGDETAFDSEAFSSQVYEWIEEVVAGFCSRHNIAEMFFSFKRNQEDPINA